MGPTGPRRRRGRERSAVEELISRLRAARPDAAPTALTLSADRHAPVMVALGRSDAVFLDAYDGRVLGEGSRAAREFFRSVVAWHRSLGAEGERACKRPRDHRGCNLAFLFLVASGAFLWWPRERSWRRAAFRRALSGRAARPRPRLQLAQRHRHMAQRAAVPHRRVGRGDLVPLGGRPAVPRVRGDASAARQPATRRRGRSAAGRSAAEAADASRRSTGSTRSGRVPGRRSPVGRRS